MPTTDAGIAFVKINSEKLHSVGLQVQKSNLRKVKWYTENLEVGIADRIDYCDLASIKHRLATLLNLTLEFVRTNDWHRQN